VELEDRLTIETPEGVDLQVTLAGLGSRAGAAAIDTVILGVIFVIVVIAIVLVGFGDVSDDVLVLLLGIGALIIFIIFFGYYLLFETLNSGRTPGKSALGIRVIRLDGTPLGFGAVAIRTLLRVVDSLPVLNAAGILTILATPRNQRIGDLAAGTVVVRESQPSVPPTELEGSHILAGKPAWDTSGLGDEEIALVRRFVERRSSLSPTNREQLAASIAGKLRSKVVAPDDPESNEAFLVRLLAERLHRER
jgi:uncharacterized RDD family membrane protein YckC